MKTLQQWIDQCNIIHNNKYDYSLWTPQTTKSSYKVKIICPLHGEFTQILDNHRRGKGCPICGNHLRSLSKQKNKEYYINKFLLIHGDRYDYTFVPNNISSTELIKIYCKHHGIFEQTPELHAKGSGCQKCAVQQRKNTLKMIHHVASPRQLSVIQSVNKLNDKQWLEHQYKTENKTSTSIAVELGVNSQTVLNYLHKQQIDIDPIQKTSEQEREIVNWLKQFVDVQTNVRNIIKPKELDIFITEYNVAIEFCGLYWHSEQQGKDKYYHYNKWKDCQSKGITLLTIYEDEWRNYQQSVKNKILSVLGKDQRKKVFARNTNTILLTKKQKSEFFESTHIQGDGPSSINIGLVHNNQLVAAIGFIQHKNNTFYLNRYATSYQVIGGFSKLLKYFQTHYQWDKIISFADLRWSNGNLYQQTGWKLDKITPPDYYYSPPGGYYRFHKFNFRRKYLSKILQKFDHTLSERQNCNNNGILRIWDCGKMRFVIEKVSNNVSR